MEKVRGGKETEKERKEENPNMLRPDIRLGPLMSKYSKTFSQLDLVSLAAHSSQVSLEGSTGH